MLTRYRHLAIDDYAGPVDDNTEEAWKRWLERAFPDWRTRFADLMD